MIINKKQMEYRTTEGNIGQKLVVSYTNKDGGVSFLQYPLKDSDMFVWKTCSQAKADPEFYEYDYEKNEYKRDENGNYIKRRWMTYDNKFVARYPVKELPDYRMNELLCSFGKQVDTIFDMPVCVPLFYDIETEVTEEGVPSPDDATVQINTIAATQGKKAILWSRKPLTEEEMNWIREKVEMHSETYATDRTKANLTKGYTVEFRIFDSEYELLKDFVDYTKDIAIVAGYNSYGFDFSMVRNRCIKNGIDYDAISPTHRTYNLNFTPRSGGHKINVMLPEDRVYGDVMLCIRQWYVGPALENHTLDYVSEKFLSFKKVSHTWTYAEGFEKNRPEYCYYNIIDTINTQQIAIETGLLNVWLMLASILRISCYDAFSTIKPVETVMQNFIYNDFKVIPSDKKKIPEEQEKYEGAFVWPSKPQIARMIGGLDFASLYPSIMRQFLISPETYIEKRSKDYKPKEDEVMTSSGAVYRRDEKAIISSILTHYFGLRKDAKWEMKNADTELQYYSAILERRKAAINQQQQ